MLIVIRRKREDGGKLEDWEETGGPGGNWRAGVKLEDRKENGEPGENPRPPAEH